MGDGRWGAPNCGRSGGCGRSGWFCWPAGPKEGDMAPPPTGRKFGDLVDDNAGEDRWEAADGLACGD